MVEVYVICWHPTPVPPSGGLEASHLTTKQQGEAVQGTETPFMRVAEVCKVSNPAREVKAGLEGSIEHEGPSAKSTERRWELGLARVRFCVEGWASGSSEQGRV